MSKLCPTCVWLRTAGLHPADAQFRREIECTCASMKEETPVSKWQPISTAPKDGTWILVCELGNGEQATVFPAMYMNPNGSGKDHPDMIGFWGAWGTSRVPLHMISTHQASAHEIGLPVGFRSICLTALCWQPMPEPESMEKLRRRQSALLAHKYKGIHR